MWAILDRKIRACLHGPPGEGRQQAERGPTTERENCLAKSVTKMEVSINLGDAKQMRPFPDGDLGLSRKRLHTKPAFSDANSALPAGGRCFRA
jgi:hypothetical protein